MVILFPTAECIYTKRWYEAPSRPTSLGSKPLRPQSGSSLSSNGDPGAVAPVPSRGDGRLSVADDAKLIFGTVFSLRNMVRKLSGPYAHLLFFSHRAVSGCCCSESKLTTWEQTETISMLCLALTLVIPSST